MSDLAGGLDRGVVRNGVDVLNRLVKNRLFQRVGMLSLGVAAGQALTMLASPVLTRLFDPHAFGLLGLFTSLTFLLGNVSSLRYDLGVMLARDTAIAATLFSLCLSLNVLVALGFSIFLLAGGGGWLARLMDAPDLAGLLAWAPLQVLALGVFLPASQWASRRRLYRQQAQYQVSRAALTAGLQIAAGVLGLGAIALAGAQAIGFSIAIAWFLWQTLRIDWRRVRRGFSALRIRTVAFAFRRLPQYSAPQELLTALGQSVPYFLLGYTYGPSVVGLYWLTLRTMMMPVNFFSQALRQVLLQHMSTLHHDRRPIFPTAAKLVLGLAAAGIVIFAPVVIAGPHLFAWIFGESWREAGEFARWVSLWMITSTVKIPAWCVFHTMGRQRFQLVSEAASFIAQTAVLLAIAGRLAPGAAIASFTSVAVLFNIGFVLWALVLAHRDGRRTSACA